MADIDSLQLPDGSQFDLVDNKSDYATKGYVQDQIGTITKTTIGLGNVDNTSDANKPVSNAQQNALNEKLYSDVIADEESAFKASRRYEAGEQFTYQGALYKTTTIVPNGDDFEVGTNVELSDDILTQMSDADTELNDNISAIVNVYGSKNLFPYPYYDTTKTLNGVTYTDIGDGEISTSNNATSTSNFDLSVGFTLPKGTYTFTGCPQNGGSGKYSINLYNPDTSTSIGTDSGSGFTFTLNADTKIGAAIWIASGYGNGLTFKPMIRDARISDDTYVPYAPTNRELMSYKANGKVGAKNLFNNKGVTQTSGGVTFIVNNDKTVTTTIHAGKTYGTEILNMQSVHLEAGSYIVSGCPDGGSLWVTYIIDIDVNGEHYHDDGNGVILKLNADVDVTLTIVIYMGTDTDKTITFKPMIRIAEDTDPTYQPYAMTNMELTEKVAPKSYTINYSIGVAISTAITDGTGGVWFPIPLPFTPNKVNGSVSVTGQLRIHAHDGTDYYDVSIGSIAIAQGCIVSVSVQNLTPMKAYTLDSATGGTITFDFS